MNILTIGKKLGSLLLILAMMLTMAVTILPVSSYAESGGKIRIKYNPDIEGLETTDFKLYKVAVYDHDESGKSIFKLCGGFEACEGVDLNTPTTNAEWLAEAGNLGNYAKIHADSLEQDLRWSGTLNKSDSYQVLKDENGSEITFENGIYLLVGEEQYVGGKYWTPVPVLIQVLNGDSQFDIIDVDTKMSSRENPPTPPHTDTYKHTVRKTWQDDGYADGRPESVMIGIYNGSTLIDTVELSDEKGWVYTWYSYKGKDGWVYTSKNPADSSSKGVETSNLNEGNNFELVYGDKNSSWSTEEIAPEKYGEDENYYISNPPDAESSGDGSEMFNVVNTVLIPAKHDPPVKKIIVGDEPKKDETFKFALVAISTTAKVESMPMPEGSNGKVKYVKTKGAEEKEFGEIIFRVPGQYVYEIRELNTGKKGYTYDSTVYKIVYDISIKKVTENNETKYVAEEKRTIYKNGEVCDKAVFEFVNEYSKDSPDKPDNPGEPGKPGKPNTGDYTNYVLPAAVFAAALIAFVVVLVRRRKQNNDK